MDIHLLKSSHTFGAIPLARSRGGQSFNSMHQSIVLGLNHILSSLQLLMPGSEQRLENWTLSKSTRQDAFAFNFTDENVGRWFSWFNLPIHCGCNKFSETDPIALEKKSPMPAAGCPGQEMTAAYQCHDLYSKAKDTVGSVCIEVNGSPPVFEVTYKSSEGYLFTKNDFWFGSDTSTISINEDGLPVGDLDFFWRNSSGEEAWTTKVPLALYYSCLETEDITLSMVARSIVAQRLSDGTLDWGSKEEAFAYSLDDKRSGQAFGSFDFSFKCKCGTENQAKEPLSLPATPATGDSPRPISDALPSTPASLCVEQTAQSKRECLHLKTPNVEQPALGSVCVEVTGNPPELELSYESSRNSTFTQADFWLGKDISMMPRKRNGYPSIEKFPYFWSNSSDEISWTTKFPFNASKYCPGTESYFQLAAVAHARTERRSKNWTSAKGPTQDAFAFNFTDEKVGKWFSWFNLPIHCGCNKFSETDPIALEKKSPVPAAGCPGQEMTAAYQCHDLYSKAKDTVGSVCIEVNGSPPVFEVTYKSSEGYLFTKNDFWFGSDTSTISTNEDGLPVGDLDFFWRNSSGEEAWTTKVPLASYYSCLETEDITLSMVARSIVAQRLSDGTLDWGSKEEAFAYSLDDKRSGQAFGSFDFSFKCKCGTGNKAEEPLSLPTTHATDNSSSICPDKVAWSEKECYNVVGSDRSSAGTVCVEVSGDPPAIEVTREVTGDWVLLKSEFWYGREASDVPKRKNGVPDIEKFPYFWCNSSGEVLLVWFSLFGFFL